MDKSLSFVLQISKRIWGISNSKNKAIDNLTNSLMFTRKVFLILKAVDQKAGIKQLIIPIYSILFSPAKTDFKSFSQSIVFKELNKG
jgi:hypothetical protein